MTTNTDVKKYNAVEEVNGGIPLKNGAELRKRKESLGKRQQSFVRQNSSGVEIERPLTREDLRKSFGSKNNSVSVDQENPPPEGASGQVSSKILSTKLSELNFIGPNWKCKNGEG